MARKTYSGSCHCGAVRFRFESDEIRSGLRCNCSICIRRGSVTSPEYIPADAFAVEGEESLTVYQFGDKDMRHYFCKTCGISPFSSVAKVPADYEGRAKVGDRRVNLGCIEGLDPLTLPIRIIDGRSF
jgi:hypothetical protein